MNNYRAKELDRANCNGVVIELNRCTNNGEPWFEVSVYNQYDEWDEGDVFDEATEGDARRRFNELVEEYRDKPNMHAQAAYDEEHGTINGGDPGIYEMNELWGDY